MKTYYLAAALLMASSAAHAGSGISFQVNGQRVHIDAPRNRELLSCVQITAPGMSGNFKDLTSKLNKDKDDDDAPSPAPSTQANSTPPAPKTAPTPTASAAAPRAQAPAPLPGAVASNAQPAATDTSNTSVPLLHDVTPSASTSAPPPVSATAAAPTPAVAVSPTAQPASVADTPVTPLGLWATQDNKGNVQIEPCGQNLCGYAEKTHEPILINMKPANDSKWTGRIHDPEGGSNYDLTIAMKGPNLLKVQGCAFGGLFCGGQTWKRVS